MFLSVKVRFLIAISYFVLISYLFFLPGSALPEINWLSKIYFDKWVHTGFFGLLALLWCWALRLSYSKQLIVLAAVFSLYGMVVEVIQLYFVDNRSFDLVDWIADTAGSVIGVAVWSRGKK